MGKHLPAVSGKDFIRFLEFLGFQLARIKGSHHRLHHEDGRATTIPVHKNDDLAKGLLRKIIREDLQISLDEFDDLWQDFN